MHTFLNVALPVPLRRTFTYLAPSNPSNEIHLGARVRVPFGPRELIGVITGFEPAPDVDPSKLKPALEVLDESPIIPEELIRLCEWVAGYYLHPLGEVFNTALPQRFREGKQPEQVRYYALTNEGKGLPEDALKRAPKQQAVLQYLLSHERIAQQNLEAAELSKSAITAMLDKALIEIQEESSADENDFKNTPEKVLQEPHKTLNDEQQAAFDAVAFHRFQSYLLQGVTGSGKTELYLQLASRVLHSGGQVLVLVPEIGLSPQTLARFKKRFAVEITELHSGVAEGARAQNWIAAKTGKAKIVIGTRLASMAPFHKLGLIIIDEEHDRSYKQQDTLRYSARDISIYRAHALGIPIVLGSATPSLESIRNVEQGRYQALYLRKRAGNAIPPAIEISDLRGQTITAGLAPRTIELIRQTLMRGEQALLFLNRRGYAPAIMCHTCGWSADCRYCDLPMTVHQRQRQIRCHHCDRGRRIPDTCQNCSSADLKTTGVGTEQLEINLEEFFGDTPIIRIDRDSTRNKGSLEKKLAQGKASDACIYIGTQMLAKGHHLPNVTLVVILDGDQGLVSPDFRALEQMGQLITQVAGRSGRAEKPGMVEIQSHRPDHPMLQTLITRGYEGFAKDLLELRKTANLPPYTFTAQFRAESKRSEICVDFLKQVAGCVRKAANNKQLPINIVGPHPATIERVNDRYRYNTLIVSTSRAALKSCLQLALTEIDALALGKRTRWSLDIDPVES